jgi:hypothetical protein
MIAVFEASGKAQQLGSPPLEDQFDEFIAETAQNSAARARFARDMNARPHQDPGYCEVTAARRR